jgi:NAD(P)H-hydrate repair Nnr-like enzyme with NAD(P)H-hydrate epimerase domain
LTVAQMRAAEEALMAAGSGVHALMQRAGRGASEWVRAAWRQRAPGDRAVRAGQQWRRWPCRRPQSWPMPGCAWR